MHRPAPRNVLLAVATLAALAAAPAPARAIAPGTASARRALAATLAGDARTDGSARDGRRRCPEPLAEHAGGRLALDVERRLERWSATARRWATERAALAVYVADVTGLRELASRLAEPSA